MGKSATFGERMGRRALRLARRIGLRVAVHDAKALPIPTDPSGVLSGADRSDAFVRLRLSSEKGGALERLVVKDTDGVRTSVDRTDKSIGGAALVDSVVWPDGTAVTLPLVQGAPTEVPEGEEGEGGERRRREGKGNEREGGGRERGNTGGDRSIIIFIFFIFIFIFIFFSLSPFPRA